MSHTIRANGGTVFQHNGDFSGLVKITPPGWKHSVPVSFADILQLVAEYKRARLIEEIEREDWQKLTP